MRKTKCFVYFVNRPVNTFTKKKKKKRKKKGGWAYRRYACREYTIYHWVFFPKCHGSLKARDISTRCCARVLQDKEQWKMTIKRVNWSIYKIYQFNLEI